MEISEDQNKITLTLQAVEAKSSDIAHSCFKCYFMDKGINCDSLSISCLPKERKDGKSVYFIEVQS
jgi:hypothetical protein